MKKLSSGEKKPWHSPSECSFDHGFRVGVLKGQIELLRELKIKFRFYGFTPMVIQKDYLEPRLKKAKGGLYYALHRGR